MAEIPTFTSTTVRPIVVGPIGRCIYGEHHSRDKLSREHVIPYGFAGGEILLKASCENCREITRKIEDDVLRAHLGSWRTKVRMPSRSNTSKRRNPVTELPLVVKEFGIERSIMVPVDLCPQFIALIDYPEPPGILTGGPPKRHRKHIIKFFAKDIGMLERTRDALGLSPHAQVGVPNRLSAYSFTRWLAKMAHGHMVTLFGLDAFEPLLLNTILCHGYDVHARTDLAGYFIGAGEPLPDIEMPPISGARFATLAIQCDWLSGSDGYHYAGVRFRFCPDTPHTPTNLVIAGRAKKIPELAMHVLKHHADRE
jgi:hypothetical protein